MNEFVYVWGKETNGMALRGEWINRWKWLDRCFRVEV
jgi:hypothetical protein